MEYQPIKRLSNEVIGQIAAGEVVERPAAAVKELVENSIDAGATAVTVELTDGGIRQIRVSDNGRGIPAGQVRIAFERHTTSKLRTAEELFAVRTLGFRGEALASIAAVARVSCLTHAQGADFGVRMQVDGGQPGQPEEAASPFGTTVTVRDLFYNTPVRLKFLKKPAAEAVLVSDYILRLILSRPDIAFRFVNQGKTVYRSAGDGKLESALYCVYGREALRGMRRVQGAQGGVAVDGYVGVGELARGNRLQQSFFINGRYFRDEALSRALENGCEGYVMIGRYPICALTLAMPYQSVDVNVHPNKLQVRFQNPEAVARAVEELTREALAAVTVRERLFAPQDGITPGQPEIVTLTPLMGEEPGVPDSGTALPAVPGVPGAARPSGSPDVSDALAHAAVAVPEPYAANTAPAMGQARTLAQDAGEALLTRGVRVQTEAIFAGDWAYPAQADAAKKYPAPDAAQDALPRTTIAADEYTVAAHDAQLHGMQIESPQREGRTCKPLQAGDEGDTASQQSTPTQRESPMQEPEPSLATQDTDTEPTPWQSASQAFGSVDSEAFQPIQETLPIGEAETPLRYIGAAFRTYLLFEAGERLLLVDQHAAHERVLYDRFMARYEAGSASQHLLSPQVVRLTPRDVMELAAMEDTLLDAGLEVEAFDPTSVAVRAVPVILGEAAPVRELLLDVLDEAHSARGKVTRERLRRRVTQMACKHAIKAGDALRGEDVASLLRQMLDTGAQPTCPHGRPIVTELTRRELEKRFKRIQ